MCVSAKVQHRLRNVEAEYPFVKNASADWQNFSPDGQTVNFEVDI